MTAFTEVNFIASISQVLFCSRKKVYKNRRKDWRSIF